MNKGIEYRKTIISANKNAAFFIFRNCKNHIIGQPILYGYIFGWLTIKFCDTTTAGSKPYNAIVALKNWKYLFVR